METDATWQAKAESSTGEAAGSLVTRSRKSVTYSGSMLESTAQPSDSHLSVLSKAKVTAMGAFVNVFQQQERDRVMVKMTQ